MTATNLIAFIRSKLSDTWWDFHGPSITKAVEEFEQSVREDALNKLPGFVSRKPLGPERVELL